ncbi:hypothetical protein PLICRDRAFT_236625 [Plicaturopsis crispa FD-325 SS-3]|nr:hypothetical protein PLICRDRAFT_236625 [Plicaturopsis crispa FD-325 SS-3]
MQTHFGFDMAVAIFVLFAESLPAMSGAFSSPSIPTSRLASRQNGIPNVPPACTSLCNPVNTQVNQGCTPTACCTSSFNAAYGTCLACVGTELNITDFSGAQQDLDQLYGECLEVGRVVPELTLPGQNPHRSLPVVSGASTLPASSISFSAPASSSAVRSTSVSKSAVSSTHLTSSTTISQSTVTSRSQSTVRPQSTITPSSSTTAVNPASPTASTGSTSSGVRQVQRPWSGIVMIALVSVFAVR